jgi:20S proteasome alpha/beta subunit
MKLEEATSLAIKCLSKVIEGKLDSEKERVAVIPMDTKSFTWISGEELDNYLEKITE